MAQIMGIGLGRGLSLLLTEDSESRRPEGKASADWPGPGPLAPSQLVIPEGQMHPNYGVGGLSDEAADSCVGQLAESPSKVNGQLVGRNALLEKPSTGLACPGSRGPHHVPGSRTTSGTGREQPEGSEVSV